MNTRKVPRIRTAFRHEVQGTIAAGVVLVGSLSACQSAFEDSPSLIDKTTIIAIQAEPPEGAPGTMVQFQALVVSAEGTLSTAPIDWALCNQPRSVAENNSVAPGCFTPGSEHLVPVGEFQSEQPARTLILSNSCALFGSEPAPSAPGEAPVRPADPDATGGYYAPILASFSELTNPEAAQGRAEVLVAVGLVRVRCALPSAPVDIARDYAERYSNNQNPVLEKLRLIDSQGNEVSRFLEGETLQIEASWQPESSEEFVIYEPESQALKDAKEALNVAWFVTSGALTAERSVAESGAVQVRVKWTAPLKWTAPSEKKDVQIWAVLRDNRGGMSWKQISVAGK